MKKIISPLLLLPFIFCCSSTENSEQEQLINAVNLIEKKEIKLQNFNYPTGELQFQGNYNLDGSQQGLWKEYWKNGQLRAEGKLLDSKIVGLWKYYYEDGKIQREVDIIEEGNGYVKLYYKNGKLSFEGGMKNGMDDGLCKSYYENGQLKSIGTIKNNKGVGLWKTYDQTGQLIEQKNL